MDGVSIRRLAEKLGTNAPRVARVLRNLGINPQLVGNRAALTNEQAAAVRCVLGVVPAAPGLSRVQTQVLAALSHAPLGLRSARALAWRAGVSPTIASRAVSELVAQGLATVSIERVVEGSVRDARVIRANYPDERYVRLAGDLALVVLPALRPRCTATRVPPRLGHLFWNTASSQRDVRSAGGYIARRLLAMEDLDGLAWGAAALSAADWRHGARARGLAPRMRTLALNLAETAQT